MNTHLKHESRRVLAALMLILVGASTAAAQKPELVVQAGHRAMIRALALSPDGTLLASGGADKAVIIWDLVAERQIRSFMGHGAWVTSLAFSPDSKFLASGSYDGTVRIWNLSGATTDAEITSVRPYNITSLAFSPLGDVLAIASAHKDINLWDLHTREMRPPLQGHSDAVTQVAFRPSGDALFSTSLDRTYRAWNLTNMTSRATGQAPEGLTAFAHSPDRQVLALSMVEGAVFALDTKTLKGLSIVYPPADPAPPGQIEFRHWRRGFTLTGSQSANTLAFISDKMLASVDTFRVKVWNVVTKKTLLSREIEYSDGGYALAVDRKGNLLIYADGLDIHLLDLTTLKTRKLKGGFRRFQALSFSSDGRTLAGLYGEDVGLWGDKEVYSAEEVYTLAKSLSWETHILLWSKPMSVTINSADKKRQADIIVRHKVGLGASRGRERERVLRGHRKAITSIAVDPQETKLASRDIDGTVVLWNLDTLKPIKRIGAKVGVIQFSPDGGLLAIATDQRVEFWNMKTLTREPTTINDHISLTMRFSPDGKLIAGMSKESPSYPTQMKIANGLYSPDTRDELLEVLAKHHRAALKLWRVDTGELLHSFVTQSPSDPTGLDYNKSANKSHHEPFGYAVFEAANSYGNATGLIGFSHDSALVASRMTGYLAADNQVKVWDVASGRELHSLSGHTDSVRWVTFSPDKKILASAGWDTTLKLWSLDTGGELATIFPLAERDWVIVTPDGRFDTNLPLERLDRLTWVWPADPLKPLSLRVFMRDYYEPKLLTKILAGEELKPVRDLSGMNRTQPAVSIREVKPDDAGTVQVTLDVSSVLSQTQLDAGGGLAQSGVFDVRLLRDQRLVASSTTYESLAEYVVHASAPGTAQAPDERELELWRRAHEVRLDAHGRAELTFRHVQLSRGSGAREVSFSAYAFNRDRVTSEATAPHIHKLPPGAAKGKRRAYVITVGVDANRSDWNLDFAAQSATGVEKALREKLSGAYEVVSVHLLSTREPYSPRIALDHATKGNIRAVLEGLGGRGADEDLGRKIPGAGALRRATPYDLVVLYISSHGYADPQGNFYVIPSDTGQPAGVTETVLDGCFAKAGQAPDCSDARAFLSRAISSDELAVWWRGVDAGEMVMILDSCYSAAVSGRQFRPGPLGDRGFGQLSYDKGMMILTAAQPDKPALATLRVGTGRSLLSAALIFGAAKWPRQPIKDWLTWAETSVPLAYGKLYPGAGAKDLQLPSLLDFTRN